MVANESHNRNFIGTIRGFTFIEIVCVLLLVGIIGAVIATGMTTFNTDLIASTETLKSHIRYVQSKAMSTHSVWYLKFGANQYEIFRDGNPTHMFLPGSDGNKVDLNGYTVDNGGSIYISFNSWGSPGTDQSATTLQNNTRTVTLTKGSESQSLTIIKNTGFIP